MKKFLLLLLLPTGLLAQVCDSLISPCVSTFSRNGYFFDLEALNPIQIQGFSFTAQNAGTRTIEVYYKNGTHVGSENNASAWTLIGTMTNITPAFAISCPLPHNQFLFASAINMNGGDRFGFYFQMTSGTGTLESHSNITTGNIGAQDVNLILYSGVGANPIAAAFSQTLTQNLTFQGAVIYDCVTSVEENNYTEVTLFPNPAGQQLTLTAHPGMVYSGSVLDVSGKQVMDAGSFLVSGSVIELSALAPGIYTLLLQDHEGGRIVRRFVKQP
ncbi:MAG: T9SS type A sorting domain-containing protein [Bacteroidia bacterium]|nr:T9SS type A sorting domain-containing protein [Bacteroidia bacterium]